MRAKRAGKLYAHVSEAAETDDADFFTGADFPMTQRRIRGDAGAQQGRDASETEVLRESENEVFIDDDALGITSVGGQTKVFVHGAERHDGRRRELLEAFFTMRAGQIGIHEAADAGEVAWLEFSDLRTDLGDTAYDFVTWHGGVLSEVPLVAREVEIRVADAAVENLYLDIAIGELAARDSRSGERRGGARRGVGFDGIGFGLKHKDEVAGAG